MTETAIESEKKEHNIRTIVDLLHRQLDIVEKLMEPEIIWQVDEHGKASVVK